jgi:hypothetical protein
MKQSDVANGLLEVEIRLLVELLAVARLHHDLR